MCTCRFAACCVFIAAALRLPPRDRTRGVTYLKYLAEEIALQASALNGETQVKHMHWGGWHAEFLHAR
jgi:coproporphyrinogen III oxidase-like Fe-S oxidoreductase